jgi:hypothetical protein
MIGSNSFGIALVAGKNRVPKPATGKTALVIWGILMTSIDISIGITLLYLPIGGILGKRDKFACGAFCG